MLLVRSKDPSLMRHARALHSGTLRGGHERVDAGLDAGSRMVPERVHSGSTRPRGCRRLALVVLLTGVVLVAVSVPWLHHTYQAPASLTSYHAAAAAAATLVGLPEHSTVVDAPAWQSHEALVGFDVAEPELTTVSVAPSYPPNPNHGRCEFEVAELLTSVGLGA